MAAVCVAAPTALQAHNIGVGKSLTSYPSFKEQLQERYTYKEDSVVVDGWYNPPCCLSLHPSSVLYWVLVKSGKKMRSVYEEMCCLFQVT
jgi:hypothetical protein